MKPLGIIYVIWRENNNVNSVINSYDTKIKYAMQMAFRRYSNMQKGKKSEVNKQEINIGTKRTDPSNKQKNEKKGNKI